MKTCKKCGLEYEYYVDAHDYCKCCVHHVVNELEAQLTRKEETLKAEMDITSLLRHNLKTADRRETELKAANAELETNLSVSQESVRAMTEAATEQAHSKEELTDKIEYVRKVANNAIYFDDSSDYEGALGRICSLLGMDLGDVGMKFEEEEID